MVTKFPASLTVSDTSLIKESALQAERWPPFHERKKKLRLNPETAALQNCYTMSITEQ